jgi:transcriptional regulator with XRE-family HTH domain
MVRGVSIPDLTPGTVDYRSTPEYAERMRHVLAKQLQHYLRKKGWSQADLARRANNAMPEGSVKLNRDNISRYCRGENFPNPERIEAMCKALGITYEQLVPEDQRLTEDEFLAIHNKPRWRVELNTDADGCRLIVDSDLPFDIGVKVVELLRPYAPPKLKVVRDED